ncbi:MAG: hypothetical protein IAE88_10595 [Rhodobacteraceae bacterium]|nr:hypothetical protein [Paracoccaceae bacterium]
MSSRLITTWSEYDSAVEEILDLSRNSLLIFDRDLAPLKLEQPERIVALRRLLSSQQDGRRLTVVVQQPDFVRQRSPQLMNLLALHAPAMSIIHSPPHLDRLKDCLLIADGRQLLVRFHQDQPRARVIVDDARECAPYLLRFDEILGEGGTPLSSITLGL